MRLIWPAAVASGRIDVIGTGHAPHTVAEKAARYAAAPSGLPLVQHAMPALIADQPRAADADPVLSRCGCGWTPFAGRSFRSRVRTTLVSGRIAWHNGALNPACRGKALEFDR